MYLEIRTDDLSRILREVEQTLTEGRAGQFTVNREGWLFRMSLSSGDTESDAAPVSVDRAA